MRSLKANYRRHRWFWGMLILAVCLAGGALCLEATSRFEAAALEPVPGPLVLDREGRILRLAANPQGQRLVNLPEGKIPPLVAQAFIAAEDQRFWQHPGVDASAVLRAAGQNLAARRIVSGASTLTMQLSRLAYPGPRTFGRKVVEALRSLRIERAFSKEDILRAYLNRVPLGGNLLGVETAALAYFDKPAAALNSAEAALLAALAKAPTGLRPTGPKSDRLVARQRWVLSRMAHLGFLTSEELYASLQDPWFFTARAGESPSCRSRPRTLSRWSFPGETSPGCRGPLGHHPGSPPGAAGGGGHALPPGPAAKSRGLPGRPRWWWTTAPWRSWPWPAPTSTATVTAASITARWPCVPPVPP